MTRALAVCLVVGLAGCYSAKDFSPVGDDTPGAPKACGEPPNCDYANGEVRTCVDGFCTAPPIPNLTSPSLPSVVDETFLGNGLGRTLVFDDVTLRGTGGDPLNIVADYIVIQGTVTGDPTTGSIFRILARKSMWIREQTAFRNSVPNRQPVSFVIQANEKLYIDDSADIEVPELATCVCLFGDGGNDRGDDPFFKNLCGVAGSTCTRPPLCGNRTVDPGEECDDGNTRLDDGCDATCLLER